MEVDGVVCVIRICGKIFESVVCLMDVKEMILEVIYLKMKEKCCIYDSVCKGGWMNVCWVLNFRKLVCDVEVRNFYFYILEFICIVCVEFLKCE